MDQACVSLHSVRWQTGAIEELSARTVEDNEDKQQISNEDSVCEEFDPFEGLEEGHKCTTCDWTADEDDRDVIVGHYRSQWHRFNARRRLRGRQPLDENQFEELGEEERIVDGEAASSSTDTDDSDYDDLPIKLRSSHIYFTHNDEVFSMYRCVLRPGEATFSLDIFARPLNCAIFLLAGGHFAGGIYDNGKLVAHKAFHRYVVRAKQGGVQSANDRAKGNAHSAGATLRRYNERALREDIVGVLKIWSELLATTPLIFIRCASYQRVIFHDVDDAGFDRKDPRLRTIPFETKRPLLDEVRRVWDRLASVTCHGPLKEFLAERAKRKQRAKILVKKKDVDRRWSVDNVDEKEKSSTKEKKHMNEIGEKLQKDHLKMTSPAAEVKVEVDRWPALDKEIRREIYVLVKENKDEALRSLVQEKGLEVVDYLIGNRFSSDNGTFLHLAAKNGSDKVLEFLLEIGCDPSTKNSDDMVPYAISTSKAIRQIFVHFRSENPEKWNWPRCHIPEPVQITDEQAAKLAEKKREKKQKQKEKIKLKKEADRKEAEELAARAAFIALSDREKRAAAAEARLALLAGGPRCAQCGVAYNGPGFECMELKFCSPSCVAVYRRGGASL